MALFRWLDDCERTIEEGIAAVMMLLLRFIVEVSRLYVLVSEGEDCS